MIVLNPFIILRGKSDGLINKLRRDEFVDL